MYSEIKEKAVENLKEKRAKKRGVHTVGVIFTAVSIILFVISMNFHPTVGYWVRFPILVLALVYATIYFSIFGIPFVSGDDELSDEEIEREMAKIYRLEHGNSSEEFEEDSLELREVERLGNSWEDDEELV